jgi:F-type H+-transporting ATPase subunit delta
MIRRFARPYARAIIDVVGSPAAAQDVRQELEAFEAARRGATELQEFYANPGFDHAVKMNVTNAIAKKLGMSDLAIKVLEVLIRNHRINYLGGIVEALASYIREATNTVAADVRTAHVLSDAERAELQSTLERKFGRKVELGLTTDPALLGGFVAKVGSEIYDASVVGKIERFRESLS